MSRTGSSDAAHPDARRRRLLLAVPGGLVVASPLALVACGGGGSSSDAAPEEAPPNAPPGPVGSAVTTVQVDLPTGLADTAGALRVVSATGEAAVTGTTAQLDVLDGGPQLCGVLAQDGSPLALGWAGAGQAPLSAHSTARVLLHFALGVPLFGAEVRDTLRDRLASRPAVDTLAQALTQALAADRTVLRRMPDHLLAAINTATAALLPARAQASARARPLGVLVDDAAERSGVSVQQGAEFNSIFIQNVFARRAVCFVNREATVGADGVRVPEPQGPVQIDEMITVPVPAAIDSLGGVLNGWANEYYSGESAGTFFRSVTEPVTLKVVPEGARRTEYSLVVLMPGSLGRDATRFARLNPSQQARLTSPDLGTNLYLQAWLLDLVVPAMSALLPERLTSVEWVNALGGSLMGVLTGNAADLVQEVSAGRMGAFEAFKRVMAAMTFDPATGTFSALGVEILKALMRQAALRLSSLALRRQMWEASVNLGVAGARLPVALIPVLGLLGNIDKLLLGMQTSRVCTDLARSRAMEEWTVTATLARVTLTPNPFEVDPLGTFVPITAGITDVDANESGVDSGAIEFQWVCSARYGTLFKRGPGNDTNQFQTSAVNAVCDYQPSGQEPGDEPETITVKAILKTIGSTKPPELIGEVTRTVTFKKAFSLVISPNTETDLPTELSFPLTASIREELPPGTTVEWLWSHAGVGRIRTDPRFAEVYANNPSMSTTDLVTDSTEGQATVTVRAQVNVPGSTTAPPRSVLTNPVSVRLNVKSDVEAITLRPPGGAFACRDPQACGVSYYGAYIVPVLDRAISYTARFSGFGYGPCNRSISWTRPVGDGGGCSFPITYHPHNSRGPTNFWAVWLGFSNQWAPEGEFEVTILVRKP